MVDYFPYGKVLREYVPGNIDERFLTTYHERDHFTGLDYRGARFYDSDVGRFLSLDPLAADYVSLSPYNYVAGNPIIFVDPDGRAIVNGAEVHRKKAEGQYNGAKMALNNAKEKYGTRRRDFKKAGKLKEFKKAKKRLRQTKRDLKAWTRESKNTTKRIKEFSDENPAMFNEIDNLDNANGDRVDVYFVTTNNVEGPKDGATLMGFNETDRNEPFSQFGNNTIEVQLTNSPSGGRTTLEVTQHESGHVSYQGENAKSYFDFLTKNGYFDRPYDGHASDDPSGKRADEYQNKD